MFVSSSRAQPSLSDASPSALIPGKTIDLTLHGAKLTEPLSIWTSFPAKVEITTSPASKKAAKQVRCTITPAADAPFGIGGVIVANKNGPSNVLMVMIDDLPSVASTDGNSSVANAQPLTLPVAVDGTSQAAGSRFYRFDAKAGQRVSLEVVAQRLGSAMDPVVWLRDGNGVELALADDDDSLGADCRLSHTFQADGQYTIELRDNRYRGGHRYRMRVGDFPLVSTAYPLGGQLGSTVQLVFAGPDSTRTPPINITIPRETFNERWPIGVRLPDGRSSSMATVAVSRLAEVLESEPNNEPDEAATIALPVALNGRFDAAGDRDLYQFVAKKGERITFQPVTRRVGSPSFVFMRVLRADGRELAQTKLSDSYDVPLSYAIPADGTYFLSVEDLLQRGGGDYAYRIEAAANAKGFSLQLKSDKTGRYQFTAPKNGAFAVDLLCQRDGYNGPITLSVQGPHGDYEVYNNVIAAKQKTAKIIVVTPPGAKESDFMPLRIIGTATVDGEQFTAMAGSVALIRSKMPNLAYPPPWLDGLVSVATAGDTKTFFAVEAPRQGVHFPQMLGSTTFTVVPKRIDKDFQAGLVVLLEDLPAGFSYAVKTIGKAPKEKYQITITGPKETAQRTHNFQLVSYGELKGLGLIATQEVLLQVFSPLSVSVTPAGPIATGKTQKVTINVIRYTRGDAKSRQPVTIKWKKLPTGIKAEAQYTLAADEDEIEIEITAGDDAAPNTFDQLVVQAETKYQGKSLTAQSEPVILEVTKP